MGLEITESDLGFLLAVAVATVILGFGYYLALSANGLGLVGLKGRQIGSRIPRRELVQMMTDSGLRVWVPVTEDQTGGCSLASNAVFPPRIAA